MPKLSRLERLSRSSLPHNPLDEDGILREQFYGKKLAPAARPAKEKPTHYKIVCISLYTEDIARLDGMVAELKRRGHTKANKSAVIRFALDNCDLAKMPKGY
jgi:hypothetical protein